MRRFLPFPALLVVAALAAGAEARRQVGRVVVGGMTLGTLLTLFVVPAVYTFIGGRHRAAAASPISCEVRH